MATGLQREKEVELAFRLMTLLTLWAVVGSYLLANLFLVLLAYIQAD